MDVFILGNFNLPWIIVARSRHNEGKGRVNKDFSGCSPGLISRSCRERENKSVCLSL